jgi:uncharacterized protein YciI
MPWFVWIGRDGRGALEARKRERPAHLERLRALDREGRIRFAGPLRDASAQPRGSVIVFEAPDLEAARAFAAADPYATGGVFASWEVFETLQVFPE